MPTRSLKGSGWSFTLLSTITSALAIVALAQHALVTWSLSAPMALIMNAYNDLMELLIGWVHAYLQAALTWIGSFIAWRPRPYPHWRDVFLLVTIYFSAFLRGFTENIRVPIVALMQLLVQIFLLSLLVALIGGLVPLSSSDIISQSIVAGSVGIVSFVGQAAYGQIKLRSLGILLWLFVVVPMSITFLVRDWLGIIHGAGLVGLTVTVVWFGLALLSKEGEPRSIGISITGGFIGAFIFFAIDAGLKVLMG